MALSANARLGPYEILAPLGVGGMGEVWKARDTRLDRLVAIKTIHGVFSERFEREARAISALNHPHICALYDVGEHEGAGYLVMEYVEGAALKGPLPLDQALRYAAQICDALDAAHRKGIVHRDLKPDNILRTKAGVKLLDFGLAKLAAPPAVAGSAESTSAIRREAEIATKALTGAHVILGTPKYMAPEQIEGRDADARTDLFAFGCVLYELLTGQKAFDGKTPSSTMAAILATEPRPMRELQPVTPPALERIVTRCLAKDADDRWQTARDLKAELEWIVKGGTISDGALVEHVPARTIKLAWMLAATFGIVAAVTVWAPWRTPPPEAPVVAVDINPPPDVVFGTRVVISPDGRSLVAQARTGGFGTTYLMVRRLDSLTWRRLSSTEEAFAPSWSPDSRAVVFVTGPGKVKRIDVAGGPAQTLCDSPPGFIPFTTWSKDGVILFSGLDGLRRVSASGGASTAVTAFDQSRQESLHGVPQFLPDGRHFLYWARSVLPDKSAVLVGSLEAPADATNRKAIPAGTVSALFAPDPRGKGGHLLFDRDGALVAQPFDLSRLQLAGESFPVAPQVGRQNSLLNASVSDNGVLVYLTESAGALARQIAWFDRGGKPLGDVGPPGVYLDSSLSPDEKRLAVARRDSDNDDIWIIKLEPPATFTRLTFHPGSDRFPVWSPDGTRVLFRSARETGDGLYEKPAAGIASERLVMKAAGGIKTPTDWSPDGRSLLYQDLGDIWVLTDGKPVALTKTGAQEGHAQFSPDGKWIAYTSNESNRNDIYVQSFPASSGGKWLISSAGGSQPRWRKDGKELFYLANDGVLMAVPVNAADGAFETGVAETLFQTRLVGNANSLHYSVSRDGQRFLVDNPVLGVSRPVTVITNWLASVKK